MIILQLPCAHFNQQLKKNFKIVYDQQILLTYSTRQNAFPVAKTNRVTDLYRDILFNQITYAFTYLLYGLNTCQVIHCNSEVSQVQGKSRVTPPAGMNVRPSLQGNTLGTCVFPTRLQSGQVQQ